MNTITNTRTRGITGCVIDSAKLAKLIASQLIENGARPEVTTDIYPEDCILVLSDSGAEFALINTEGVGTYSDGIQSLTAWYTRGVYGTVLYSISLPFRAVEALDTDHETVDLADHIRTFGARLDSNHQGWVNWYNYN